MHRTIVTCLVLGLAGLAATPARAVPACELNGQHVNPENGNTTQGKTGLMRCRDADGRLRSERVYDERGRVTRELELDGNGAVIRDDEVFEDGSRKAFGK